MIRRIGYEILESYRKNRGDLQGLVFRHYPNFLLHSKPQPIQDQVIVFAFHSVGPVRFERQLQYLHRNGYHVLPTADALYACLRGEQPIPPRAVLLTFDDGRESLYTVAFPLLQRYGMRAVSFVVPSFVGQPRFCDWRQLRELHASGIVDIQSHTFFHRFAPRWPRVVPCVGGERGCAEQAATQYLTLADDYQRAREVLEEQLDKSVRHLCYPDYDGTNDSVAASEKTGHVSNFWGVIPGRRTNRAGDDPFRIVRVVDDYLRCLPGEGRESLWQVAGRRIQDYRKPLADRLLRGIHVPTDTGMED